jgi:N-acetylglutamate synthase-like GNAT family acetyltransferase
MGANEGPTYRRADASDHDAVLRVLATANFRPVPSPEMPEFDLDRCFVAKIAGEIVGAAGFKVLPDGSGKTTLMAVHPSYRRNGVGERLQEARMQAMHRLGCKRVVTNADSPETIEWYQRKFGYRKVGTLEKLHGFGDPDVDHWTTLEADLDVWSAARSPRRHSTASGTHTGQH